MKTPKHKLSHTEKQKTVRVIDRAVDIINCFDGSHPKMTLQEIAQKSGVHKTTTFRLLTTLVQAGLITQLHSNNQFSLSMMPVRMANTVLSTNPIRQKAWPLMQRLRDQIDETVILAVRDKDNSVDYDKVDASHLFESSATLGQALPLHKSVPGIAILATFSKEEITRYYDDLTASSADGDGVIAALKAPFAAYKSRGVIQRSVSSEYHHTQLAVPLLDLEGTAVAALYFSVPKGRLENLPQFELYLKKAAVAFPRLLNAKTASSPQRTRTPRLSRKRQEAQT